MRRTAKASLERRGYDIVLAENGVEGLRIFQALSGKISLVLLDIEMPLMDGPTMLAALRQIDPNVRCCFISGYTGYTTEQLAGMRAVGLIEKPFQLQALADTVKAMLGT